MGLAYIVAEFCTQSHLATEDFDDALKGMKVTRWFKKHTYWFRMLLSLWDNMLLLMLKVVRFSWEKATRRQKATKRASTARNKTLYWGWRAERPRRESSSQPLLENSQDEASSRNSRSPERSEGEDLEDHAHDSEQHDTQDEGLPRIRVSTPQLPTQSHPRSTYLQLPLPSSETSQFPV